MKFKHGTRSRVLKYYCQKAKAWQPGWVYEVDDNE